MIEPTMIYKAPGPELLHGVKVAYSIVDAHEVEAMLADGWYRSPLEAHAALAEEIAQPKPAEEFIDTVSPPTRAELEAKARELGITFDGRTKDAGLLAKINAAGVT